MGPQRRPKLRGKLLKMRLGMLSRLSRRTEDQQVASRHPFSLSARLMKWRITVRTCADMIKLAAATVFVFCVLVGSSAVADELLWARKSKLGGLTTIAIGQNGTLYCTGCNFNNYGPIEIQRGPLVDTNEIRVMEPWMSTLWLVLFLVDQGNRCGGEFYTLSLYTHNLERIDTSRFQCNPVNVSITDDGETTFTDKRGHREVLKVQ
jgi:hypothetical protein